jgi:hypothetical protein
MNRFQSSDVHEATRTATRQTRFDDFAAWGRFARCSWRTQIKECGRELPVPRDARAQPAKSNKCLEFAANRGRPGQFELTSYWCDSGRRGPCVERVTASPSPRFRTSLIWGACGAERLVVEDRKGGPDDERRRNGKDDTDNAEQAASSEKGENYQNWMYASGRPQYDWTEELIDRQAQCCKVGRVSNNGTYSEIVLEGHESGDCSGDGWSDDGDRLQYSGHQREKQCVRDSEYQAEADIGKHGSKYDNSENADKIAPQDRVQIGQDVIRDEMALPWRDQPQ